MDGRSLMPFAHDPALRTKRAILHETGGRKLRRPREQDERTNAARPMQARDDLPRDPYARWLYVRWRDGSRELYDLRRDPDELHSLHAGRAHRHVRQCSPGGCAALATAPATRCRR